MELNFKEITKVNLFEEKQKSLLKQGLNKMLEQRKKGGKKFRTKKMGGGMMKRPMMNKGGSIKS